MSKPRPKVRGVNNARPYTKLNDDELFEIATREPARLGRLYSREGGYSLLDFATFDGSGLLEGISVRSTPNGFWGNHRGR